MKSYIEDNLNHNENIIETAIFSKCDMIIYLILFVIIILIAIVPCILYKDTITLVMLSPFLLIFLIMFLKQLLYVKTSELASTEKRIISRVGSITTKSLDISIDKISNIEVEQNLLGRIFDFGTIIIKSGVDNGFKIKNIKQPHKFKNSIMQQHSALSTHMRN